MQKQFFKCLKGFGFNELIQLDIFAAMQETLTEGKGLLQFTSSTLWIVLKTEMIKFQTQTGYIKRVNTNC